MPCVACHLTLCAVQGMHRKLEQATGLRTINLGYPSRSQPLASLAKGVAAEILQEVGSQGQVFIITHSMVRTLLSGHPQMLYHSIA